MNDPSGHFNKFLLVSHFLFFSFFVACKIMLREKNPPFLDIFAKKKHVKDFHRPTLSIERNKTHTQMERLHKRSVQQKEKQKKKT